MLDEMVWVLPRKYHKRQLQILIRNAKQSQISDPRCQIWEAPYKTALFMLSQLTYRFRKLGKGFHGI